MFKVFLTFLFFFAEIGAVCAQTGFSDSKNEQEKTLTKYINASAVCAKMTDSQALYERGMLLISDANEDSYMAAADCFTSAALKNHTPSQLELGKLYEKGNGVSQSNIFAYKWYQTAVLLGNQEALSYRNKLEARMTLDEISMANPMIQSTLDLIDVLNQRQQAELDMLENKITDMYMGFGVDISQYDIQEEATSVFNNPLIDALIKEQKVNKNAQLKESAQKKDDSPQQNAGKGKEKGKSKSSSKRRVKLMK